MLSWTGRDGQSCWANLMKSSQGPERRGQQIAMLRVRWGMAVSRHAEARCWGVGQRLPNKGCSSFSHLAEDRTSPMSSWTGGVLIYSHPRLGDQEGGCQGLLV